MVLTDTFWAAMALATGFGPKERMDGSLAWGREFHSLAPTETDGSRAVYYVLGMPVHCEELITIGAAMRLVGPGVVLSLHSVFPHSEVRDHVREVVRRSIDMRGSIDMSDDPLRCYEDQVLSELAKLLAENVATQDYELWSRSLPFWSLARNVSLLAPAFFEGQPPGAAPVPVSALAEGLGLAQPVPEDVAERAARMRLRPGR